MKIYKLFTAVLSGMFLYSCTEPLNNPLEDVNISVQTGDGVTVENNVITVTRNTPVKFNIMGEPDNITFYSGESGHNYDYRNRDTIQTSQIQSSKMTFSITAEKYGNSTSYTDVLHMYLSDKFTGLYKDDFAKDVELANNFEWDTWVPVEQLLTKPSESKEYEIDMTPYLGKSITLAIKYEAKTTEQVQGRYAFGNMKITNVFKDGKVSEIYAGKFGFMPLNVSNIDADGNISLDSEQEKLLKEVPNFVGDDGNFVRSFIEYGTVNKNVGGMWNMTNANRGNFSIHGSSSAEKQSDVHLKKSWLISDYLVINGCEPDKGTALKNIANRFESYEYTYNTVGTYKAVFVLSNANYKEEDNRTITMIINVK